MCPVERTQSGGSAGGGWEDETKLHKLHKSVEQSVNLHHSAASHVSNMKPATDLKNHRSPQRNESNQMGQMLDLKRGALVLQQAGDQNNSREKEKRI